LTFPLGRPFGTLRVPIPTLVANGRIRIIRVNRVGHVSHHGLDDHHDILTGNALTFTKGDCGIGHLPLFVRLKATRFAAFWTVAQQVAGIVLFARMNGLGNTEKQ
jgi:hypothetical protein